MPQIIEWHPSGAFCFIRIRRWKYQKDGVDFFVKNKIQSIGRLTEFKKQKPPRCELDGSCKFSIFQSFDLLTPFPT